ncbi:hypothetical protein HXP44_01375 [Streptomyces sioyaensis]|uniref:hypothetical protein n=1 Tax=Streptomyces sioyaensis TaxID=67364 RepID=UPI0019401E77|nr:hypothetical protein [Streptomyces sioyaensis]MBM4790748.1 hypothetical protein [Streptomyces sioyaensis]
MAESDSEGGPLATTLSPPDSEVPTLQLSWNEPRDAVWDHRANVVVARLADPPSPDRYSAEGQLPPLS